MKKLVFIGLMVSSVCGAENLNSELLMKKVEKSSPIELIEVIKQGKSESEILDSYSLIILSMASLKSEDTLSAEVFLYQALLRAGVDKQVYTPTRTGGDSPLLALMAF